MEVSTLAVGKARRPLRGGEEVRQRARRRPRPVVGEHLNRGNARREPPRRRLGGAGAAAARDGRVDEALQLARAQREGGLGGGGGDEEALEIQSSEERVDAFALRRPSVADESPPPSLPTRSHTPRSSARPTVCPCARTALTLSTSCSVVPRRSTRSSRAVSSPAGLTSAARSPRQPGGLRSPWTRMRSGRSEEGGDPGAEERRSCAMPSKSTSMSAVTFGAGGARTQTRAPGGRERLERQVVRRPPLSEVYSACFDGDDAHSSSERGSESVSSRRAPTMPSRSDRDRRSR